MAEERIGQVTHYYRNIGVAVVDISDGTLSVGDTIHIKGHTSDFTHAVESMQLDGTPIEKASKGQSIGLKVTEHVRIKDGVFKVKNDGGGRTEFLGGAPMAMKNTRRTILLIGGVLVLAVALLGDVIGGVPGFGVLQITGTIVGAVAIVAGLLLKRG